MNSTEISLLLDAKDREIIESMELLNTVSVEQHNLKKRVLELGESVRQAKSNLSKKRVERSILEREYWRSK